MTALKMREVTCSNCADPLGEFVTEPPYDRIGRCCENLPSPWTRGHDGRYTGHDDDAANREETAYEEAARRHAWTISGLIDYDNDERFLRDMDDDLMSGDCSYLVVAGCDCPNCWVYTS